MWPTGSHWSLRRCVCPHARHRLPYRLRFSTATSRRTRGMEHTPLLPKAGQELAVRCEPAVVHKIVEVWWRASGFPNGHALASLAAESMQGGRFPHRLYLAARCVCVSVCLCACVCVCADPQVRRSKLWLAPQLAFDWGQKDSHRRVRLSSILCRYCACGGDESFGCGACYTQRGGTSFTLVPAVAHPRSASAG